jgi:hypothetical protein
MENYDSMSMKELYQEISRMESELQSAKDVYRKKYGEKYVTVIIWNHAGNISERITKETGFECHWKRPERQGNIGENVIVIPREVYKVDMYHDLFEKYDNVSEVRLEDMPAIKEVEAQL